MYVYVCILNPIKRALVCGAVLCTLVVSLSYLDGVVVDQDSLLYTVQLQQLVLGLTLFQTLNTLAIKCLGNQIRITILAGGTSYRKSLTVTIWAKKLESFCLA